MGFSKIEAVSLTELFVQQIENMILSGELKVDEQLPPVRELSSRMGISRSVINAGLVELEKLGFVEIRARQGVFVSDYRRKGTIETLEAIMRFNSGTMRKAEVRSLLEVREYLECLCVSLVIEKCTDEEIESLGLFLDKLKLTRDADEAAELVFGFYHEMAVMSGNVLLPLMYHSFKSPGTYLWRKYCLKFGTGSLYSLKLNFYRALLNRDLDAAQSLTRKIMLDAIENIDMYAQ